jgi:hypothetical protein
MLNMMDESEDSFSLPQELYRSEKLGNIIAYPAIVCQV